MRRVKRPDLPRTTQQLLAHAAADGIQSIYSNAKVVIGGEQVQVTRVGKSNVSDVFYVQIYRGDG